MWLKRVLFCCSHFFFNFFVPVQSIRTLYFFKIFFLKIIVILITYFNYFLIDGNFSELWWVLIREFIEFLIWNAKIGRTAIIFHILTLNKAYFWTGRYFYKAFCVLLNLVNFSLCFFICIFPAWLAHLLLFLLSAPLNTAL